MSDAQVYEVGEDIDEVLQSHYNYDVTFLDYNFVKRDCPVMHSGWLAGIEAVVDSAGTLEFNVSVIGIAII